MIDFRISVEELENEAMIAEMARTLLQEALRKELENEAMPTRIRIHCHNSWGNLTEEKIELPF